MPTLSYCYASYVHAFISHGHMNGDVCSFLCLGVGMVTRLPYECGDEVTTRDECIGVCHATECLASM